MLGKFDTRDTIFEPIIIVATFEVKSESYPIQDEPGGGIDFQHSMSLKE